MIRFRATKEFLDELRSFSQVILISDTFTQFAAPLMEKLGRPTLFCNTLEVADNGEITGFKMRVEQSKLTTVKALQSIGFDTIASGDSYNDLGMIQASKAGFLFRSTDKIKAGYDSGQTVSVYLQMRIHSTYLHHCKLPVSPFRVWKAAGSWRRTSESFHIRQFQQILRFLSESLS